MTLTFDSAPFILEQVSHNSLQRIDLRQSGGTEFRQPGEIFLYITFGY